MLRRTLFAVLLLVPFAVIAAPASLPMVDFDTKPRPGTDYEVLPTPQPTWGKSKGKIEVAEVFSYACIHCAQFQPKVDDWLKTLPKDVSYEYVPGVFNQAWENCARAFFAARELGVQERTHDNVFKAIHFQNAIQSLRPEALADWYAAQGVNRAKFLAAMSSAKTDALVKSALDFAMRTGVEATPTIIVAGKYRVMATADRGFAGMLATADALIAQEEAAAKSGRRH
jgi:thiol:disulfide interchange protein DsbA